MKDSKRKKKEAESCSHESKSRRKISKASVVEEDQIFTGEIGSKRSRQSSEILTFCADEVGAHFAVNRDYCAERRKCEDNKRVREETQSHLSSLREERDDLVSKVQVCDITLCG